MRALPRAIARHNFDTQLHKKSDLKPATARKPQKLPHTGIPEHYVSSAPAPAPPPIGPDNSIFRSIFGIDTFRIGKDELLWPVLPEREISIGGITIPNIFVDFPPDSMRALPIDLVPSPSRISVEATGPAPPSRTAPAGGGGAPINDIGD